MTSELRARIELAAKSLLAAGANEVYLFGSAATGTMRDDSDVDLAVTGLPPEVFFQAMGQAAILLHKSLDLIDLDDPSPFTEYLKKKGNLLRVA